MAKVNVTGLKQIQSTLRKEITKVLRNKQVRETVGLLVVQGIRATSYGSAGKVTQEFRRFFEQYNKTHPEYRRSNINITFTGDLLNDLKKNVKAKSSSGRFDYVIEHSDKKHKGYDSGEKRKRGKKKIEVTSLKSGKTRETRQKYSQQKIAYSLISEYLIKKGYNYLDITDKTLNRVLRYINIKLTKELSKKFK